MQAQKKSIRFQESAAFEKKSNVTRAKLMDAAINVIAANGTARSSIVDITEFAGLANGTFYLYFKSKADLVGQLGLAIIGAIVNTVHSPALEHDDAAHLVARHLCCFLRIAGSEPTWIPMIIDALGTSVEPREQIEHGIRSDIERGRRSKRFDVPECEEFVAIILALCRIGLERIRDGADIVTVQQRIMEAALRVLGIASTGSHQIAAMTAALPIWSDFQFPALVAEQ